MMNDKFQIIWTLPYHDNTKEIVRIKFPENVFPKVGTTIRLDDTERFIRGVAFERTPEMIKDHQFDCLLDKLSN